VARRPGSACANAPTGCTAYLLATRAALLQ